MEANVSVAIMKTWHERLGHLNVCAIKNLTSWNLVEGVDITNTKDFLCEACQVGKSHRLPFKRVVNRDTKPGKYVHSNLCSPMPDMSLGGTRWYITFKDDATGFRSVYFMKHKAEALDCFKKYERKVNNKFGRTMKVLRSDNGREYVNTEMSKYLATLGIVHECTAPYVQLQRRSPPHAEARTCNPKHHRIRIRCSGNCGEGSMLAQKNVK